MVLFGRGERGEGRVGARVGITVKVRYGPSALKKQKRLIFTIMQKLLLPTFDSVLLRLVALFRF